MYLLMLIAAFGLEAIGTYVSVIGLSKTFAGDNVIMGLAVVLDVVKLVLVSFLYTYWDKIGYLMKIYFVPAALVMMIITSYGAAGYLANKFQTASLDATKMEIKYEALVDEKREANKRLFQIDKEIESVPPAYQTKKQLLMDKYAQERARIDDRLVDISREMPVLKADLAEAKIHVGPIKYVSEAFKTTDSTALNIIIGLIIFVFDPLAVMLIIGANFIRARNKVDPVNTKSIIKKLKLPSKLEKDSTPERIDIMEPLFVDSTATFAIDENPTPLTFSDEEWPQFVFNIPIEPEPSIKTDDQLQGISSSTSSLEDVNADPNVKRTVIPESMNDIIKYYRS